MIASGFSWFRLIPDIDKDVPIHELGIAEHSLGPQYGVPEAHVYMHAWLTCVLLLAVAFVARGALDRVRRQRGIEQYFSDEKLTPLSAMEVFAGGIKGLMGDLLSKADVKAFFPLIAGLFAYIFINNIQGIFPGFLPPTDNINTNVGMALTSFVTFIVIGMWRDARNFVGHLLGPVWWLAWFMLPLEFVSMCIRPISLTIRLTANLFGDHQVFTIVSGLVPLLLPVALLALAVLVSVMQAFVFSLLTTIYINLSLPHHHEHEAH